jgi:hypothetical protein
MPSFVVSPIVNEINECVLPPTDHKSGPWGFGEDPRKIESILVRCIGKPDKQVRKLLEEMISTCFDSGGSAVLDKDGKEVEVPNGELNFDRASMRAILMRVAVDGYTPTFVDDPNL